MVDREQQSIGPVEIGILGGGALSTVVWAGAQLAAFLSGGEFLDVSLGDALGALVSLPTHPGEPQLAWPPAVRGELPGTTLYWLATAIVGAAVVAGVLAVLRLASGGRDSLDRRSRLGVPATGQLARSADLRPLTIRRPEPGRFVLGRAGHRIIATERATAPRRRRRRHAGRGAVALIGPTRSGKTTAAIGGILDWDGPAVLCSVKSDLLGATGQWRASQGEVQVFDPSGVTDRTTATWTPLRASANASGAVRAARALTEAAPRSQGEQPDFWSQMAESLLAALLNVAANAEGRTFADVVRWVLSTDMPVEGFVGEVPPLIRALKADADPSRKEAGQFAAMVLEGLWRNDARTVSSVYATARTMVWPWVDPLVTRASAGSTIDLDWLVSGPNTLYVCAPVADQHRLRPVLGGMLNDLVGQAFERYVRTNQPLDPALLVVMDEAAILRPDQLPSWAATLSGIGVQLVTAWQSVSQIEAAYGRHAQGILTNHLSKLFYAGMTDSPGLEYVSRLLGDEHLPARLSDGPSRGDGRREQSVATVPLVPPAALRRMHPGDALLIHGTLPPAHVRLRPWYRDRRLKKRATPRGK
jgi:type IV secretion system protein VirD4